MAPISNENVQRALMHPTRIKIIGLLVENTKQSPNDLRRALDESLGTVAYHVRTLEQLGIIKLADEKRVRGAVEHFYSLQPGAARKVSRYLVTFSTEMQTTSEALSRRYRRG